MHHYFKKPLGKYRDESYAAADKAGIPTEGKRDGIRDAFRHAYTSAVITHDFGQIAALTGGNKVETSKKYRSRTLDGLPQ